jgi:serine O-acetyltransferase
MTAPSQQPEVDNLPPERDRRGADDLSLRELLAEDFATHDRLWLEPGFWAIAAHRLGTRASRVNPELLRRPLMAAHKVLATTIDWVWGIQLPPSTRVGRRFRIWHHGSILLNARSIGDDVHIRHDTTFGPVRIADAGRPECLPVIEDNVDMGSGACVLGDVRVGKGSFVGANSVVMQPVPPGVVAFGVPARIIPK